MHRNKFIPRHSPQNVPFETDNQLRQNPTITPIRDDSTPTQVQVYEYNAQTVNVQSFDKIPDNFPQLKEGVITWINVDGLNANTVDLICQNLGIHPLFIEDILSIGQRPKMDELNDIVYTVLNMLYLVDDQIEAEQVSIFLGKGFVLSFQQDTARDVFSVVREKLKLSDSKLRQLGPDFLFYSLLDSIVDQYFVIAEDFADRIEQVEEVVIDKADKNSLAMVSNLRNEMILFKRSIAPVRELINGVMRSESKLIDPRVMKYFKDIYDHIVQVNDLTDNYRDMVMSLQDLYLNNVNLKMNEVMKVMAIATCLMAPATIISGIFGMNFENEPLLHTHMGFYISMALMIFIPAIMILFFVKRGWF